jgi:hypothetical protein
VVVRVVATLVSADPAERDLVAAAGGMQYHDRSGYHAYFGDLAADSRQRLARLLRAAARHGTRLELGVSYPPATWYHPVLASPVPPPGTSGRLSDEEHGFVEPSHVDTMLVVDVQYLPSGPAHHWWLSADPPRGTHPDPTGAWQTLCALADADPFAPASGPPTHAQPSAPGTATVQGIWHGRWVQATFNQQNDAENRRWHELRPLLQPSSL